MLDISGYHLFFMFIAGYFLCWLSFKKNRHYKLHALTEEHIFYPKKSDKEARKDYIETKKLRATESRTHTLIAGVFLIFGSLIMGLLKLVS